MITDILCSILPGHQLVGREQCTFELRRDVVPCDRHVTTSHVQQTHPLGLAREEQMKQLLHITPSQIFEAEDAY